ncbi:MerR family transcriptional regulator [Desulfonema ishimotonii]|uniref:MerR family transcriptional regulator n=1 Tax=Desulfonema ishimotonii TaxID=45657 RepID=A0A401FXP7_9BACT|nr:MerR family DNA-binding transcriptional regulator [Desulfonema ishimotonii]GBC61735.1 MerR family transcriptional regulator [Desulfonema ishimotonii]
MVQAKIPEKAYTISELASHFNISPRTIRFYEEKGLISPQRTSGNQRFYTRKDRARLRLILRGKRFGFSLDDIAGMIGMSDTDINEIEQIRKSLAYGEKKLAEIHRRGEDLALLEQDMIAIREKLLNRLAQLENKDR